MPKRTISQLIWRSTKNGAELRLPKIINTDINFQLMFGEAESHAEWTESYERNNKNYDTRVYRNLLDFKRNL